MFKLFKTILHFHYIIKIKYSTNFRKKVHRVESNVSRVRPLQVLSKRPGELLCSLPDDSTEWIDVESVEIKPEEIYTEPKSEVGIQIISDISTWVAEGIPFVEDI